MATRTSGTLSLDALWEAFILRRDHRAREQLIEQYRPIALSVLRHLGYRSDEDLEQVAMLGLMKAVDRFDPTVGYRFSTFAVPTITGEIKRYLRDHSRPVRPPRWLFELHATVIVKEAELTTRLGHAPTLVQIADALGVDLDRVVEAMAMEESCHPQSLDGLMMSVEQDRVIAPGEWLGAEDPELGRVESRLAWAQVLAELAPALRKVIELRYYENLTQKEAADRLGVSQMQVSRLERRALLRLRARAHTIRAMCNFRLPAEDVAAQAAADPNG